MAHVDALSRAPVALLLDIDVIRDAQSTSQSLHTPGTRSPGPLSINTDGLSQIKVYGRKRIVIPESLKLRVLQEGHDHCGHSQVFAKPKSKYPPTTGGQRCDMT